MTQLTVYDTILMTYLFPAIKSMVMAKNILPVKTANPIMVHNHIY